MAIVHQFDKRSGLTYVYESYSYKDNEKNVYRAKRKLIGRLDPETGDIVPTDGRGRKTKEQKEEIEKADLEKLCDKLRRQCASKDVLIKSLKSEIASLKKQVK